MRVRFESTQLTKIEGGQNSDGVRIGRVYRLLRCLWDRIWKRKVKMSQM